MKVVIGIVAAILFGILSLRLLVLDGVNKYATCANKVNQMIDGTGLDKFKGSTQTDFDKESDVVIHTKTDLSHIPACLGDFRKAWFKDVNSKYTNLVNKAGEYLNLAGVTLEKASGGENTWDDQTNIQSAYNAYKQANTQFQASLTSTEKHFFLNSN